MVGEEVGSTVVGEEVLGEAVIVAQLYEFFHRRPTGSLVVST